MIEDDDDDDDERQDRIIESKMVRKFLLGITIYKLKIARRRTVGRKDEIGTTSKTKRRTMTTVVVPIVVLVPSS